MLKDKKSGKSGLKGAQRKLAFSGTRKPKAQNPLKRIGRAKPATTPRRKKRDDGFTKTLTPTAAVAAAPLETPVSTIEVKAKTPPVVMAPCRIPGTELVGPYAPVKIPCNIKPLPEVWVRVTQGNERNGAGVVVQTNGKLAGVISTGLKVKFTGGGPTYPAKAQMLPVSVLS